MNSQCLKVKEVTKTQEQSNPTEESTSHFQTQKSDFSEEKVTSNAFLDKTYYK